MNRWTYTNTFGTRQTFNTGQNANIDVGTRVSHQIYTSMINLAYDLSLDSRAIPYGIVGGGLFLTVPLNTVGDETISSVGLEFGGGLKYFITNSIGIRFETKQLFTRVRNKADDRQELLIFQSTSLGVVFAFG